MPHFPLFVDLQDRPVLIVGGGKVALRKLEKLRPFGPRIRLIAPRILPQILECPGILAHQREFWDSDLADNPMLVIAATDDRAVNRQVSQLCRERNIPVNVADDPSLCTFLFPALVQQGHFTAGFCTDGVSPTAAAYFKTLLQTQLPEDLDEMLQWLEQQRTALKETVPDQTRRGAILRGLFYDCLDRGIPKTAVGSEPVGSVALVGAGCGKADLITLRGLRYLQRCQAVVYDELIDPALLDAVPESALRICMGKRAGSHSATQEQIQEKLIGLARTGLRVVRLKGGDPYLFGRGGEEMLALNKAGIPCVEVPGIPSPIGISAEAGIPVTHRGMSRQLHIVTAHTADTPDGLPEDMDALAKLSGTLVFLMGLSRLEQIVRRLTDAGKSPDTPAAVISGGNSPNPACIRAPLQQIAAEAAAACVQAPAIILIGDVAQLELNQI